LKDSKSKPKEKSKLKAPSSSQLNVIKKKSRNSKELVPKEPPKEEQSSTNYFKKYNSISSKYGMAKYSNV